VAVLRTVAVTLSPFLCELVTNALSPEIVVDVIEALDTRERLRERLRELAPDLLLIGLLDAEKDAVALPLLAAAPSMRVLVLASNGEHAWLHDAPGRRASLPNVSIHALKEALQKSAIRPPD
jgi:DNA-binding NarL/FixJ family response regulator